MVRNRNGGSPLQPGGGPTPETVRIGRHKFRVIDTREVGDAADGPADYHLDYPQKVLWIRAGLLALVRRFIVQHAQQWAARRAKAKPETVTIGRRRYRVVETADLGCAADGQPYQGDIDDAQRILWVRSGLTPTRRAFVIDYALAYARRRRNAAA